MTRPASQAFLHQLSAMLPCAVTDTVEEQAWHSGTLAGHQITANFVLTASGTHRLEVLASNIKEAEFDLPGAFVADISAEQTEGNTTPKLLEISALILED